MNAKKKNKNKSKPQKFPPKAETVETLESPGEKSDIILDLPDKNVNVEHVEKQESSAVVENVCTPIPIVEQTENPEIPQRPKRAKGKKKDGVIDNDKSFENKVEAIEGIKEMDSSQPEKSETVATRRKKKNKGKNASNDKNENKDVNDIVDVLETNIIDTCGDKQHEEATESIDQAIKSAKKKKKKKNRNDSEKSDKHEEFPCTIAFKELMKSENCEIDTTENIKDKVKVTELLEGDNKKIIDENLKNISESDILTDIEIVKTDEKTEEFSGISNKANKKNKKSKQAKADDKQEHEEKLNNLDDTKETPKFKDELLETLESTLSIEKEKNKAKIIKPVEKKLKNKQITPVTKYVEEIKEKIPDKIIDLQNYDKVTNRLEEIKFEIPDKATNESDIVSENNKPAVSIESELILLEPIHTQQTTTENLPEISLPENIRVQEEQKMDNIVNVDDGYVTAKTQKKKRKRQGKCEEENKGAAILSNISFEGKLEAQILGDGNDVNKCDLDRNIDSGENLAKADNLEESIINIPDLIQIPRSTSQQLLDINNNTLIQDISAQDDFKLSIPLFSELPLIEGSGESPEVQLIHCTTQIEPSLKVSEIETKENKNNQEKTDIKSKMIEVNRDMEELRLSIEKSLAELTAIDNNEKNTEKNFEERIRKEKNPPNEISEIMQDSQGVSSLEIMQSGSGLDKQLKSKLEVKDTLYKTCSESEEIKQTEPDSASNEPLVCLSKKDNKGKSKSKRKGKQDTTVTASCSSTSSTPSQDQSKEKNSSSTKSEQDLNKNKNSDEKSSSQEKGKQQDMNVITKDNTEPIISDLSFEPIENFEDALTSSVDDVNKTFELIVNEIKTEQIHRDYNENPQINIIAPAEDEQKESKEKQNPVMKPKNLLGHPNIPVPSTKTDYKKEKNKLPNCRKATVKIKDSVEIEKLSEKQSKECQIKINKKDFFKNAINSESFSYMTNENNEFIYKYSFRKVFLQSICNVCKKDLCSSSRFSCKFCSLIFYCSQKHMSDDWPRHQSLCFAVSTIAHMKDQQHIYADIKNITAQDYRMLRMRMIVSCEKILKRKLEPWEQEALLYPRICAEYSCREWRQTKLKDCEGCGQISYCIDHPEHLTSSHQRWCKSYALYQKLVNHQQTKGRLEPQLPSKILQHNFIPDKINDVLASIFEEKIDMTDVEYAALTQLATAPLTTAYCYQMYTKKMNSTCANGVLKKSNFIIHTVGAELQYEADALNKWEIFFLHLRPDISDLRVVLVALDLNPSNLPLNILGKFKLCDSCRSSDRRVTFHFHDKVNYDEYCLSEDYIAPDIVCAFNQSIQRSSIHNGNDPWQSAIKSIIKQKTPFVITAYSLEEVQRDMARVEECSRGGFGVVLEPSINQFASVRPDRNFITDHETPLLFKNYACSVLCGSF